MASSFSASSNRRMASSSMAPSSSTSSNRRMASSSSKQSSYDVFLSFRGKDVRKTFLDHLYTALVQKGIHTYKDDKNLRTGEQISPALMKAIEESRIAIVVFSENYASSTWCLDELAKIMECEKERDLTVFPVFYKVDPREVRTPREIYKRAMDSHEKKFMKDLGKVKRWKKALSAAGKLSGLHFTDGFEAKLIEDIMQKISTQLDLMPLSVATFQVGLDSRVQELRKILKLQSKNDVLMVGLWGLGGVGKTTLAEAVYNDMYEEFHCSSFLERVRENSNALNGLVCLQHNLLSDVLLGEKFPFHSLSKGSQMIKRRLCNKKALIILDDVDDNKQLEALAGECDWFGPGSRIIITTRDYQVLISHRIHWDRIYKVEVLKESEALELFEKHAFRGNQKGEISQKLVDRVSHYARGLPLALMVLGFSLYGKEKCEWESALTDLSKNPVTRIKNVLRVSYDGLDWYEKEIFLDIACFFKGQSVEYIIKVLTSCVNSDDPDPKRAVRTLIERSLIREEHQTLQMHDLIQSMGKDIVKGECRKDPEKRSRLWLYDDVRNILSTNSGTDTIRAITLRLPKRKKMFICSNAFTNMRKLRLLILHNVHNTFVGPIHLPNELRWLEWPHCTSTPEFGDGPKNLVGLDLRNSNIEGILKPLKDFKKLKFVNFSGCQSLICMPDSLDKAKHLKELNLAKTSVKELPASIKNLVSLERLDLGDCKELMILPSSIYWLQNLKHLWLQGCQKLIKFPKKEEGTSDAHMKTGFPKLQHLALGDCNLSEVEFLESPSCFPLLRILRLEENNFTILPSCRHLNDLSDLGVFHCQQLQEIRGIPWSLHYLWAVGCKSLCKIPSDIYRASYIALSACEKLAYDELIIKDTFKLENIRTKFDLVDRHDFHLDVVLPGEEMPEWLVPNNEGHISFIAPKDLFEKFIGLAFCVVFRGKEGHGAPFWWNGAVDGIPWTSGCTEFFVNSGHVWLKGCREKCNKGNGFRPNDCRHFQFIIRASFHAIMKKCGFRLIWKPLDNDLEVLLKYNPWLHPNIFYQLGHEDSKTSTMEESSNEREDLLGSKTSTEASNQVLRASDDFSLKKYRYSMIYPNHRSIRLGGEMPGEFIPIEDGTICFKVSQDLYNKFRGLAICIIFSAKDGKNKISFDIEPYLDGQMRNVLSGTLDSSESDHMWIQYLETNVLWGFLEGGVDFDQFDKRDIQFSLRLRISDGTVKKMGYVVRCMPLEDDLKAVLEDDQSLNLASLYEDSIDGSEDPDTDIFPSMELLRKFHLDVDSETDQTEWGDYSSDNETDQTESGDDSSEED